MNNEYYWDTVPAMHCDTLIMNSDEVISLEDDDTTPGPYKPWQLPFRYRYRTHDDPDDVGIRDLIWLFLQQVEGKWVWWLSDGSGLYHIMPEVKTAEEAAATAVALWRTS